MIQYLITNERTGATRTLVADYSSRVLNLAFASNNRGFAECTGFVPMGLSEAFGLYNSFGTMRVQIVDSSSSTLFDGRLEDVAITGDGVSLTALGYSRALSDAPYTALWSDARVGGWTFLTSDDVAGTSKDRYAFDTNNRLYISPQKGATFANGSDVGIMGYRIPNGSSRNITGVAFDYEMLAPANWKLILESRDAAWGTPATITTIVATGAVLRGSAAFSINTPAIDFIFVNLTGGVSTPAGETGANYAKITNVRVVSSMTNLINTTLGTAIALGTRTVTPASMARIYVGQRLVIAHGLASSESVIVTAVTSTTFTAVFANAHLATDLVYGLVIYADDIADDLIATTAALNPSQLSTAIALTASPALDLQNEIYLDKLPAAILDYLAGVGDALGNSWEWGVKSDQRLYLRAQGTNARTWYIDVSDINVRRTLGQLSNSIYAVYQDTNSRTLRAAATSDSASIARYGLTRRAAISVSTTSATQAAYQQATALADRRTPQPQSGVTVDRIFDANGTRMPLYQVLAGDTIVIRNLAPTLSSAIDRVRVFRLARVGYSFESDSLSLEPETPLPTLDALLARIAAGVK